MAGMAPIDGLRSILETKTFYFSGGKMKMSRVVLALTLVSVFSFGTVQNGYSMDKPCASRISKELKDKIIAMAERSKKEKKGLTVYLAGQSVALIVTEVIGAEAIVGRNQQHDQVLIRLDRVLGLAMN